jgi:hypothetical protein
MEGLTGVLHAPLGNNLEIKGLSGSENAPADDARKYVARRWSRRGLSMEFPER